jgi:GH15 family glucan-1,4-alpha-glucosidase
MTMQNGVSELDGARGSVQASVAAILRNQEPNGAIVASRDFATYNYCWLRDGSFIAYALDRAGEHEAAGRFHAWVARATDGIADVIEDAITRQQSGRPLRLEHMPPARFALDGTLEGGEEDWPNFQIDGYGTWLWALEQHLIHDGTSELPDELRESVVRTARYVDALALTPCFDVWEEHGSARHGSTLACIYGGLHAAARMLEMPALLDRAEQVRVAAGEGSDKSGRFAKSTESDAVDSSLLWLSQPFGLVESDDPRFLQTVDAIEAELTFIGGLRRYQTDTFYGSGSWPVLTASLGWHYAARGELDAAQRCQRWVIEHFDAEGRLAEQFGGELRDPDHYHQWVEQWGTPAAELTWSHAMYVVLCKELEAQAGDSSELIR